MRILFATKDHLPIVGGAEVTTHCVATELERRGHSVTVFARQDPRLAPLAEVDRSLGYLTLRSDSPEHALDGVLDSCAPDVVVVGGYHAETDAWARSMLEGARQLPTLLHLHDYSAAPLAADPGLEIDAVVAVSDFTAREVEAHGARAISIPPAVERRRYRVSSSRRVALMINPIIQKGVDLVWALAEARPDIEFALTRCWYIAPETVDLLEVRARRLGNVVIRPAVHEPGRLYGDARVVLIPSAYPEAWGRTAAEAQMSGIPVIASNVGGLAEAVGEGGILLDADAGLDSWLHALSNLWDDDAAYRSHAARAEQHGLRTDLDPRAVGDRFEAVLVDVVDRL